MKKTIRKTTAKKTKAGQKHVLYANVALINKTWVQKQAKLAGIHQGVYMDYLLKAARQGKFQITTITGR